MKTTLMTFALLTLFSLKVSAQERYVTLTADGRNIPTGGGVQSNAVAIAESERVEVLTLSFSLAAITIYKDSILFGYTHDDVRNAQRPIALQ